MSAQVRSRNLSRTLAELGNGLGHERWRLERPDPASVRFNLSGADVDLAKWETALTGGASDLEWAARLYRNARILSGWKGPWIEKEQSRLKTHLVDALNSSALRKLDHGEWSEAIRLYEISYEVNPWHPEPEAQALVRLLELFRQRRRFNSMRRLYDDFLSRSEQNSRPIPAQIREHYRKQRDLAAKFNSEPAFGRLPHPISQFVERQQDIDTVSRLVSQNRLTTLTGAGGVGKTRLAIAAATQLQEEFYDRALFFDLTDLEDPAGIWKLTAQTLRLEDDPTVSHADTICDFMRAKEYLLVLDNCEHMATATAQFVTRVLETCPDIKVLSTSRQPLGLIGEAVWRVPSLDCPEQDVQIEPEDFGRFSAIRFFVDRAGSADRPFALDARNIEAVVQICRRLDGIPLAIEMAASQVHRRFLSVQEVAGSLDDALRSLDRGSSAAPQRQKTLRAAMEWSHDTLTEQQQVVLRRLSVFHGWDIEAAEQVCSGGSIDRNDFAGLLQALIDRSLVEPSKSAGTARFRLLETIRQYAHEKLQQSGESTVSRQLYCGYFAHLAEEAELMLKGERESIWLERVDRELANLLSAIALSIQASEVEIALRICGALKAFWLTRGHLNTGLEWCMAALAVTPEFQRSPACAKANMAAGGLALTLGRFDFATSYFEESLAIYTESDDCRGIASSLGNLGLAASASGKSELAREHLQRCLSVFEELGDRAGIAGCLLGLGNSYMIDSAEARDYYHKYLAISREMGDLKGIAYAQSNLALGAQTPDEWSSARQDLGQVLAYFKQLGDRQREAALLGNLGIANYNLGDYIASRDCFRQSLAISRPFRISQTIAPCLAALAKLAFAESQTLLADNTAEAAALRRAARLWGAAHGIDEQRMKQLSAAELQEFERDCSSARSILGEAAWNAAWEEGQDMDMDQAIEYAGMDE